MALHTFLTSNICTDTDARCCVLADIRVSGSTRRPAIRLISSMQPPVNVGGFLSYLPCPKHRGFAL